MKIFSFKKFTITLIAVFIFAYSAKIVSAQTDQVSQSSLYVPLIGISSVPEPLALPNGSGNVTYHYAVKNFLSDYPLSNIQVSDDKCSSVNFTEGDDNNDGKLDYSETWRYTCSVWLTTTTRSIATATGVTNNISATHKAYVTVIVGSQNPAPLVSIVNITKVAYPLSLPAEGGNITYVYRVNNPGVVPLSNVKVVDDKCRAMSSKLGDTNGNNLLDITEVWIYSCTMHLKQTTTNTAMVTAFANGLQAVGAVTIAVIVKVPNLPEAGSDSNLNVNLKITVWEILLIILMVLILFLNLTPKAPKGSVREKRGKKV